MTKPDDIPPHVLEAARSAYYLAGTGIEGTVTAIACAIMAERKRVIDLIDDEEIWIGTVAPENMLEFTEYRDVIVARLNSMEGTK